MGGAAPPRVSTLNYKVKTVAGGDDINATIIPRRGGGGAMGGGHGRFPAVSFCETATKPTATSFGPLRRNVGPVDDKCLKY